MLPDYVDEKIERNVNDASSHSSTIVTDKDNRALASIFAAYSITATLWLLFATAVGIVLAYKFGAPDFGAGAWLTFGRLRPIHTNATFFGWASVALVGLAYYVAVRSSRTSLYSVKLGWVGLVLFNVAAVAGTVALDLGYNDGNLEYREWPWPIRLIFLAALVVTAWNLIGTVARRSTDDIYLSNWYTIGGVLWTCIIALVAILPWYQYGLGQVSVSGYYMHNAVGMWFTPLALGIFYYALPRLLSRPIYSYALGVLAFWTNLVFYPIIGAHHFLFSPLPWWLQTTAIVFSVAMLVPVWGGSANFLLTMRGRVRDLAHSYPLMFILVGVIGYLVGSTQGTVEAFRSLQEVWHLTNFTIGHSHLTMYGFVTFAIWGGVYALLPLATGKEPGPLGLMVHFWMAVVGSFIYVISLSIGGTIQGLNWKNGMPFIQSVVDMQAYHVWRGVGGALMFMSHIVFAWNVWRMTYGRAAKAAPFAALAPVSPQHEQAGPDRRRVHPDLRGSRPRDGRAAGHRAVGNAARRRRRAAHRATGRRSRRLCCKRLQLLPHAAGPAVATGQDLWTPVGTGRLRLPNAGTAWFAAHGAGSDQHRRAAAKRSVAIHASLQSAFGSAGIGHARLRLDVRGRRPSAARGDVHRAAKGVCAGHRCGRALA
ncbi:MAG TPA: cbb3-type cytochrome c oxidase subunit I [Burkholderiales bacterium]|nr:cbb3-type cytochrome c oxidase subunit I [Burkholderiales bacterium]